jgi:hypothetical protein
MRTIYICIEYEERAHWVINFPPLFFFSHSLYLKDERKKKKEKFYDAIAIGMLIFHFVSFIKKNNILLLTINNNFFFTNLMREDKIFSP